MSGDYLILKHRTLKAWCFENSPEALEALREYNASGVSGSLVLRKDTTRQKELICMMIDKVNGSVQSDWTDEDWTNNRDAAKEYVMNCQVKISS